MVTVPLYTFFFLYLAFLVIFAIFSFVNIMHIIATSSYTLTSLIFTLATLIMTLFIFFTTWQLLQGVDWQLTVKIFDTSWFTNIFSLS